MIDLAALERIARAEFADIVVDVYRIDAKLRLLLVDESYLDLWWSEVQDGRFAHHWMAVHDVQVDSLSALPRAVK